MIIVTEEYPYTPSNRLKEFIEGIPERGEPKKINIPYLNELGFKSKNDRSIPKVLEFIGFIDKKGIPTERYRQYKVRSTQKALMAQSIKIAYAKLFELYKDANIKDRKTLEDFFATKTKGGRQVIGLLARTFETLCSLGDFQAEPPPEVITTTQQELVTVPTTRQLVSPAKSIPSININIQFVLPESKDPDLYDKIFEALKKHLLE